MITYFFITTSDNGIISVQNDEKSQITDVKTNNNVKPVLPEYKFDRDETISRRLYFNRHKYFSMSS